MYIGRNIPKQHPDEKQKVVTEEELDEFFENQTIITGCTRIPGKGLWEGDLELSQQVILLNITLREVLRLAQAYIGHFLQKAVYIELTSTRAFEYTGEQLP